MRGPARRTAPCVRFVAATIMAFSTLAIPIPARSQEQQGRQIAVVVRVSMPRAFDPSGRAIGSTTSEVAELTARLAALRRDDLDAAPYALWIPGVVCDELRLMRSAESRRLLRELRLHARTAPVLSTTHADVRLPDLRPRDIDGEIERASSAIRSCVGAEPRSVFAPPDLTLPETDVLGPLREAGAVVALSAFAVPPSELRPTIVPSVEFDADTTVDSLVSARPETPGIAVVIDAARRNVASILSRLVDDERFALRGLGALARLDVVGGVIDTASPAPDRYRRSIRLAAEALEHMRSFTLPDNRTVAIYQTVLARVRSSAEWNPDYDLGQRRADALRKTIEGQLDLISVADGSVTFTSSRGSIPVTVGNGAPYPVRLRIEVSSPKLNFPDGAANVVEIEPPGDTITFRAIARSTGAFPTTVVVKTQRGELELARGELTVRSTATNLSAVLLTAGGALFFSAWFVRRLRQRRAQGDAA